MSSDRPVTDATGRGALRALCRDVGACFASEVAAGARECWATGVEAVDASGRGGLPCGTLSEVVEARPGCGGTLLLHQLLARSRAEGRYTALVDGADAFAPDCAPVGDLRQLYWVRCGEADTALRAAELLVGDGNFFLLMLDLRRLESRALGGVPGARWYRLQRAARRSGCLVLVLGRRAVAVSAVFRVRLSRPFGLATLDRPRASLCAEVRAESCGPARERRSG